MKRSLLDRRKGSITERYLARYKLERVRLYTDLETLLVDYHLDGKVRRKNDGRIGYIHIDLGYSIPYPFRFYPLKKNGEAGNKPDGNIGDLGLEFERYEDGV